MSSIRKKAVRLSQDHLIKLGDYLRANKADLETNVQTYRRIAVTASQALGFSISTNSIGRVSDMVGVNIKTINNGGVERRKLRQQQIDVLRDAIIGIYNRCGEAVPDTLTSDWPSKEQ